MIIEQIKTIDGKTVTHFFPENTEDIKELEKMKKKGELDEIDGFQANIPLEDIDL